MLQFFPTVEGYVSTGRNEDSDYVWFEYIYQYKDHLGNNRLSYKEGLSVLGIDNYYPFGLKHEGYDQIIVFPYNPGGGRMELGYLYNNYKYNAKEFQDEFNINLYDYGARNYDPAIGRWFNIDPLAEKYRKWSPYTYAVNNPIRFTDPDGMQVDDVIIKGNKAKEAFSQLNASTSLKLKMDDNGKVTASGKVKTDADKKLLEATTNTNVVVQVNATSSNFTESGHWYVGGAYGGSTVGADGKTNTTQTVNPDMTGKIDEFYGMEKGVSMMHEVIESYIGGVDSPSVGSPTFDNTTPEFKAYNSAHDKTDIVDPRHIAPTLSQDPTTGHLYINKPHPAVPQLNVELLINNLSK